MQFKSVECKVVRGHGVASGQNGDPRFPGGTLQMQKPLFEARGLCLKAYFSGTINVSIHPHRYLVQRPKHTFRQVKWTVDAPPEDFSFFDCQIVINGQCLDGLIYYPHPDTKPEHFQSSDTLEILTEFIHGLSYGMSLGLMYKPEQLLIDG